MNWELLFESYPNIAIKIFGRLDRKTLKRCLKVNKTWNRGIKPEKRFWRNETYGHPGWDNEDLAELDFEIYTALGKAFLDIQNLYPKRNLSKRNDTHPIFCAIYLDDVEILKKLTDIWPEFLSLNYPQRQCQNGFTLLHVAALEGSLDTFKYLIDFHEIKNPKDNQQRTPLHEAAVNGHFEMVQLILQNIVYDNSLKDESDLTPLHLASKFGHLEVVQILVQKSNDIEIPKTVTGITPLHLASQNGHLNIVEYFSSQVSCNMNPRNNFGQTPLHLAAENGHSEVVELILNHIEEDANPRDHSGQTPLHLAAKNGHLGVIQHILPNTKQDKHIHDSTGQTPLHLAAEFGRSEVVKLILATIQCTCNPRNLSGQTPLILAIKNHHANIMNQLLDKSTKETLEGRIRETESETEVWV